MVSRGMTVPSPKEGRFPALLPCKTRFCFGNKSSFPGNIPNRTDPSASARILQLFGCWRHCQRFYTVHPGQESLHVRPARRCAALNGRNLAARFSPHSQFNDKWQYQRIAFHFFPNVTTDGILDRFFDIRPFHMIVFFMAG